MSSVPRPISIDLVEPGNIDLMNRPVVQNDDGSFSTVSSMSFEDDNGNQVLIPMITPDGKKLNGTEAINYYYQTGQHLGKFKSIGAATTYAKELHKQQETLYSK